MTTPGPILTKLHRNNTIIDLAKPDIILENETWLTPVIKNSEMSPDFFDAVRKDRATDAHEGVLFAFTHDLLCTETPKLDTNFEIIWCKLNIIGCRTLYKCTLVLFYRPSDKIDNVYLEEFNSSLSGLCLIKVHMFWLEKSLFVVI